MTRKRPKTETAQRPHSARAAQRAWIYLSLILVAMAYLGSSLLRQGRELTTNQPQLLSAPSDTAPEAALAERFGSASAGRDVPRRAVASAVDTAADFDWYTDLLFDSDDDLEDQLAGLPDEIIDDLLSGTAESLLRYSETLPQSAEVATPRDAWLSDTTATPAVAARLPSQRELTGRDGVALASFVAEPQQPPQQQQPAAAPASPAAAPTTGTAAAAASAVNTEDSYLRDVGSWMRGLAVPMLEGGIYGGYEFTYLGTRPVGDGRLRVTDLPTGERQLLDTDAGHGSGSRWTLGIRSGSVGIRGRYWRFGEERLDRFHEDWSSVWPRMERLQSLDMRALDVELTQSYSVMEHAVEVAFGMRYAKFDGSNSLFASGRLGDKLELHGQTLTQKMFEGIGPTFAISGRKNLPWTFACGPAADPCDAGWAWYWSARGALMWGDTLAKAATEAQVVTLGEEFGFGFSRSADSALASRDAESKLLHTELGLGLEYQRQLVLLPSRLHLRAGLEYQAWDTGRTAARSDSFAFLASENPLFGGRIDAIAASDSRFMNLFGFSFSARLNF